jgi:hypothetical protein
LEPHVGIVFLVGDRLYIDATPLSQAGDYGHFKINEKGHDVYAETLGISDAYEAVPRGRVALDTRSGKFTLLADRCILREPKHIAEILRRMNLPKAAVRTGTDSHYRCVRCLNAADKLSAMAEFEIEFRDVPTPAQGGIRQAVNTYDLEVDIIEDNSFVVTRNKGGRYSLTCIKSGNRGNRRLNSGWIDETEPADIAKRMIALAKRN